MTYAISKILGPFTEPSVLLLLVCVVGAMFFLVRPNSKWGRALLIGGVMALALCAMLPVSNWLMQPLEERFPPLHQIPRTVDGIIVLGGAIDLKESAERAAPELNERAGRMTAFVALARLYPQARLVFTGGNPSIFAQGPTEAEVARTFFAELGLDPRRVLFENRSRNTHENALFSKRLVRPASDQTWLLVTSAVDMPRAVGCFRAVGWSVTAFPVDYHAGQWEPGFRPTLASGLKNLDWAAHEWVGLIYYRLRGWTPTLFPSP